MIISIHGCDCKYRRIQTDFAFVHFPSGSACAVRPNASMHTASIRSAGHLLGAGAVGGREVVENKCMDGIQFRMSLTEHEENEVDEEGIEFSNEMNNDFFPFSFEDPPPGYNDERALEHSQSEDSLQDTETSNDR